MKSLTKWFRWLRFGYSRDEQINSTRSRRHAAERDPTQQLIIERLEDRLAHIRYLAARGWNVSSGFIAGLPGQTEERLMANFRLARELPLDGCSVSPFIPGDETPLAKAPTADIDLTLNCMAALRLMRPDSVLFDLQHMKLQARE